MRRRATQFIKRGKEEGIFAAIYQDEVDVLCGLFVWDATTFLSFILYLKIRHLSFSGRIRNAATIAESTSLRGP